ncbi:tRNA (guanine-N(7)-)-methyltransferase [Smittium culicis]|uniref:tRNA (guanine-N(7)-)-methyltransferase n=1 Tax=Smittium culicis TaxID=133412 RepID=A0A1R1YCT2_9FUNG|nr:tRNA (guanine-N(7)-)-methyltransferase [Smittium culicis]OMJ24734.1 tRNA (guanine-N(7)-)-methyltransferase [Smittium culicis]
MPLEYPLNPESMDWSGLYPDYFTAGTSGESEAPTASSGDREEVPAAEAGGCAASADGLKRKLAGEPESSLSLAKKAKSDEGESKSGSEDKVVEFADIGCGYGGLLVALSPLYPDTLMLGMEIRTKLVNYVQKRIEALRTIQDKLDAGISSEAEAKLEQDAAKRNELISNEADDEEDLNEEEKRKVEEAGETKVVVDGKYKNIAVVRMNAMKYLPNFFAKGQLSKIFFLFPDPHFKKRKHKARIISTSLISEYAFATKIGGICYTITDVEDLHLWMKEHLDSHPLFERIPDEELLGKDPVVEAVFNCTEEGRKVTRNKGQKFLACYRRISDPYDN